MLAEAKRADFAYLKKVLELTDGNLGRHLQVLEKTGYVELDKVFENGKPRTWVTLRAERPLRSERRTRHHGTIHPTRPKTLTSRRDNHVVHITINRLGRSSQNRPSDRSPMAGIISRHGWAGLRRGLGAEPGIPGA